ncbi:discoidin, CUB and LCCL domain-containing protein 1 [Clarias gariepinus]|uniref:discoidin, CUB and LCCL domain-containing protein 1 n=1 Tax=Clarias gariepinus TaxID=13013 RepID=UPI00234C3AAA|nr:discoidin, CUB and LCCL domain-containing protein 1 [Clarias gariepinus]
MFAEISLYGLVFVCLTVSPRTLAEKEPEDGCGHSDLGPHSGLLSSRNYPDEYPNSSLCEWKIRVDSSLRIVIKFEEVSVDLVDCETDYLKLLKENLGMRSVYWQYCGESRSLPTLTNRRLYTDASELTVSLRSSPHSPSRGFRLSYTTVNHTELLTCTNKGSHFSSSRYRKLCPAGCGAAEGDVAGDVSQGYRHTSVLCKAAVHAGIFPDQLGGEITVEEQRGLRYYESVRANGIQSKTGSLSETLFTFVTNDCTRQMVLQPVSVNSSWEKDRFDGTRSNWSPAPTGTGDSESDGKPWLQLDLGEKRRITGILTKGSDYGNFVKSYKIMYKIKEKSRWRAYTHTEYNSSEDVIFEGNLDNLYQTRNTFHPSFAARYIRVVPLEWHRGIGLSVELLGCSYVRELPVFSVVNVTSQVTQEVLSSQPNPQDDSEVPEHLPQPDLVKLVVIVVSAAACVAVVLVSGICAFKLLQKKKNKENMYDSADHPQVATGCWKQVKHPSARQQSTEFTFSYSSEKDHLPKMDLVTSDMADYQQPLMLGVGTVSRKGSTFRPIDSEAKDNTNEATSHYDFPPTANQYALPLTNQEPEYATPIIERHTFRKDVFVPDPSYSVPGVVLSKSSSFKATDNSNYRKVAGGNVSAEYQTPQAKRDRPNHADRAKPGRPNNSEGVYDSPKGKNPAGLQNGGSSEYQRPQAQGYLAPRDCVRLDASVPHRPDPEGCSLSGT